MVSPLEQESVLSRWISGPASGRRGATSIANPGISGCSNFLTLRGSSITLISSNWLTGIGCSGSQGLLPPVTMAHCGQAQAYLRVSEYIPSHHQWRTRAPYIHLSSKVPSHQGRVVLLEELLMQVTSNSSLLPVFLFGIEVEQHPIHQGKS